MKTVKLFLLIIIVASLSTCKKEHQGPSCENLPNGPLTGWQFFVDTPYYQFPYFNPNNPNEIIYQKLDNANSNTALYKYNLLTKSKTLVYAGQNIFQPKWGRNDWILLNPFDANIWKIKSNGDSLTQITFGSSDFAPEWNISSDKISFYRSNGAFQELIIANSNGIELDTLSNAYTTQACWQHVKLIATLNELHLSVINPENDTRDILFEDGNLRFPSGAYWMPDGLTIVWSYDQGIFKTNMNTKETTRIKASCETKTYQFPTYSPQLNKFVWQRLVQEPLDRETVLVTSRLFMMNPDGSGEEEIVLD